ncbi:MAG: hypothetical protein RMY28_020185 [Nostoc sp. ChiSLP01]|nr:hypothetical protein [Nostoc sp. CmiSLP01]MDZ8287889.1 hypothetical protein [Nostoc sp. ChiSLP01]
MRESALTALTSNRYSQAIAYDRLAAIARTKISNKSNCQSFLAVMHLNQHIVSY